MRFFAKHTNRQRQHLPFDKGVSFETNDFNVLCLYAISSEMEYFVVNTLNTYVRRPIESIQSLKPVLFLPDATPFVHTTKKNATQV